MDLFCSSMVLGVFGIGLVSGLDWASFAQLNFALVALLYLHEDDIFHDVD